MSLITVFELARFVLAAPNVRRGIIVGTHLQADVVLPPEVIFVSLSTQPAAPGPDAADLTGILDREETEGARAKLWERVLNRIRRNHPSVAGLWRPLEPT